MLCGSPQVCHVRSKTFFRKRPLDIPCTVLPVYVVARLRSPPRRHFREDGGTDKENGKESGKDSGRESSTKETASKDKTEKAERSTE